jgi:hypothetical protein
MSDADTKPPDLSPELLELLAEASTYLKSRAPSIDLGRKLLERNTVELLGAYVQAEREVANGGRS